ncbi:MAG: macro domain-containing protein [Candidatus Dependentiae bacterium]|nr:macro domain-containing protein [Candidatus Dependentiae bacterium]
MKKLLIILSLIIFSTNASIFVSGKTAQITDKTTITLCSGNITQAQVDAIVNAANESLLAGGGVCGAIFAAAGKAQLQAECDAYPILCGTNMVRCSTGQAKITSSCRLLNKGIKYIIHAVGPDCRTITDEKEQDALLRSTYENALALADHHGITSIAFPFISSAIYAFPKERAARIALETVMQYTLEHKNSTHLKQINFVLFSPDDYELFDETIIIFKQVSYITGKTISTFK